MRKPLQKHWISNDCATVFTAELRKGLAIVSAVSSRVNAATIHIIVRIFHLVNHLQRVSVKPYRAIIFFRIEGATFVLSLEFFIQLVTLSKGA